MVHGLSTCSHCGALLNSPICAICGKSERDEVEIVEAAPRERGLSPEGRRQLLGLGAVLLVAAMLGVGGYVYLTREPAEPTPLALATPTPTSSTTTTPPPTVRPPTIDRPEAVEPLQAIEVGVERSVEPSDGANPWNGAPARNVLSGEPLDNTNYQAGIDAVAALLALIPDRFSTQPPALTVWNDVDLAAAEGNQPFAARSIADDTGTITDLWIVARGPSTSDGSAAFLTQASTVWSGESPLDTFSPRPGVRLIQLADDGTETVWLDQRDEWLVLYRAPAGTDPALLGAISDSWN